MSEDRELEKIKEEMLRKLLNPAPKPTIWTPGRVTPLSQANFQQALSQTSKPVLVDFWAEWCAPCKMMAPVVEAMAREYAGKADFAKVNVDQNQGLAMRFGVMSIPNFVVFKDERPVDRVVGAVGRPGLEAVLRKHLT